MPLYKNRSPLIKTIFLSIAVVLTLFVSLSIATKLTQVHIPSKQTPIIFYDTNTKDDLRRVFLHAFNLAKSSIDISTFTFGDPYIEPTLRKKSQDGVLVTFLIDKKNSSQAKKKLGNDVHLIRRSLAGLMHSKIVVVDQKIVFLGSANLTYPSLHQHGNFVIGLYSPLLGHLLSEKIKNTPELGKLPIIEPKNFSIATQNLQLWFLPNPKALSKVIEMINSATKTLDIAIFTWTHPKITEAVIEAKKRGVNVQVVIDQNSAKGASAETVKKLQNASIPVLLSSGPSLLHYKLLVVDNEKLLTGSVNFTRAAFKKNDEVMIFLDNLTNNQNQKLKKLFKKIKQEGI